MTYNPQIPEWGEKYLDNNRENLVKYHEWLSTTGVKAGLISPKKDQYIWVKIQEKVLTHDAHLPF